LDNNFGRRRRALLAKDNAKESPMARSKPNKIAVEALSLLDLQLKLSQHPSWRILEISRLKFGFKIILQKKAKEHRQHFFAARIPAPFIKNDFVK
jgi:hypothetical protein